MKGELIRHEKVTDELGNTVEIKLWKVPITDDKPHGFKYSLAYIVRGKRVIGYDNSEYKGDHKHYKDKTESYAFKSLRKLTEDFLADIENNKETGYED